MSTTLSPTTTTAASGKLTGAQLRELARELRGELARLERMLGAGGDANGDAALLAPPHETLAGGMGAPEIAARREALQDALRRIHDGTYGICAACRAHIPYGRLLAMPETTRCIGCGGLA